MRQSHVLCSALLVVAGCAVEGDPGVAGAEGPAGPAGPKGDQGEVGPQGPAGAAGAVGAAGPMGPQGDVGPQGPVGPAGPAGPQGLRGLTGLQGSIGPQGVPGVQGPVGPVGPAGVAGPAGPAGPAGASAIRGYVTKSWANQSNHGTGNWSNVPESQLNLVTSGGPLLIGMGLSLVNGSHSACRPLIDGQWAATYAGEQDPGTPYWPAGLIYTSGVWDKWSETRLYVGVPAGPHTFLIQCVTDSGTMQVNNNSNVRSHWYILELSPPPPA